MKAITTKQTNILVPIGSNVEIKYSESSRFSLIYGNQWYGDYNISCFKLIELPLNKLNETYLETVGYVNNLMGFQDNSYSKIAQDINCLFIVNQLII